MAKAQDLKAYEATGTEAAWYKGWDITEEEREVFRQTSLASQAAKTRAVRGECNLPKHPVPSPRLRVDELMPIMPRREVSFLSLFSGGGGLDIGFDRAGFSHRASYEIREDAAAILRNAHPDWNVKAGGEGDVCHVDWIQQRHS